MFIYHIYAVVCWGSSMTGWLSPGGGAAKVINFVLLFYTIAVFKCILVFSLAAVTRQNFNKVKPSFFDL